MTTFRPASHAFEVGLLGCRKSKMQDRHTDTDNLPHISVRHGMGRSNDAKRVRRCSRCGLARRREVKRTKKGEVHAFKHLGLHAYRSAKSTCARHTRNACRSNPSEIAWWNCGIRYLARLTKVMQIQMYGQMWSSMAQQTHCVEVWRDTDVQKRRRRMI